MSDDDDDEKKNEEEVQYEMRTTFDSVSLANIRLLYIPEQCERVSRMCLWYLSMHLVLSMQMTITTRRRLSIVQAAGCGRG